MELNKNLLDAIKTFKQSDCNLTIKDLVKGIKLLEGVDTKNKLLRETFNALELGDKVRLYGDANNLYTVKAIGYPFIICTRPYNLKSTVFYTILDFEKCIRNRHNLIFNPFNFKIQKDIDKCLSHLLNKTDGISLSHRNHIDLEIFEIIKKGTRK